MKSSVFVSLVLGVALVAGGAWGKDRAAPPISATVKMHGLSTYDKVIDVTESPGMASGESHTVQNARLKQPADKIPGCIGVSFAVWFDISRAPVDGEEPVRTRFEHGPMINPDGKSYTVQNGGPAKISGPGEHYVGYTFDYGWEIVPGKWVFSLVQGDRVLASQAFEVENIVCNLVS